MQMHSETCRTKMKPRAVAEDTFYKSKGFLFRTFKNIKSLLLRGYQKLPRNFFANPIFCCGHEIGPKLQGTNNEAVNKKQRKGDEQCSKSSMRASDQNRLEDPKDEKKKKNRKFSGEKVEEPSFLATENFAQKVEELEKMDVNNGDHAMDIEEVIHHYSLLTSPVYLDIVDKFFTDVYLELYLPQQSKSRNSLMRKVGSASVHGSMGKVGSASVHSSMRKVGSASVHGSMRKVSSASVHGSMRKVGSACVHGSMRKVDSANVECSMRKLSSTSFHGSMRKQGSDSIHSSMRKLGP